jgi:MFS family permease
MRRPDHASTKFSRCAISDMVATRARLLLATLWVGSLWTIGYIVAPTLFAILDDRTLAGAIAGRLFRTEAWLSIVCGALLLLLVVRAREAFDDRQRKHLLIVIAAMVLCALISQFGIQPSMAALRESVGAAGMTAEDIKARFGQLHAIASAVYMLQSVLGVVLVLKLYHAK